MLGPCRRGCAFMQGEHCEAVAGLRLSLDALLDHPALAAGSGQWGDFLSRLFLILM